MRYDVRDADSPAPETALTDHERAMLRYTAEAAELLGLRDWTVNVQKGDTGDSILAHAEIPFGRKVVTVTLGRSFFEQTPEEQRSTVAHELMHPHLDAPYAVLRDIETQLGTLQWEMVHETYKRRNEEACDAIAEVVAKLLPMPPEKA